MGRRRKHWGWGFEDEQPSAADLGALGEGVNSLLGFDALEPEEPAPLPDFPEPRIRVPGEFVSSSTPYARAFHARGKSYVDVVAGLRADFPTTPDAVVFARGEEDVRMLLAWAAGSGTTVIPYGGGTSVVGGVTPPEGDRPVVTLNLGGMDKVLEVDQASRAARVQAGALGPDLEDQLGRHDVTLRHFPQSFEFSTLGGWIATRAGGHFATGPTHVDDLVESIRALSPVGVWESRRLPGSGAGPSPDRMLLGSEGILGVITEAWVRVQPKPEHRASRTVRFATFGDGAAAVCAIVQAGLRPANCRLVDAEEARFTGAGDGTTHLLLLAFESVDHPVDAQLDRAIELACECAGTPDEPKQSASGAWRETFLRAPYLRDSLIQLGVLSETFETACTWDQWPALHHEVLRVARKAVGDERAKVTCRFTHAYPDGPAPYFTVLAPARRGEEIEQWWAVKRAVSDALIEHGGTITHHHAVGRDHRPWYDRQRPDPFAEALRGAKRAVDPRGILNPGVLIDP